MTMAATAVVLIVMEAAAVVAVDVVGTEAKWLNRGIRGIGGSSSSFVGHKMTRLHYV